MGKRVMSLGEEITEIVQLPAIVRGGMIELCKPELLRMEPKDLKTVAVAMGGELVYMKLRATYTELETPLCSKEDCFRPVKGVMYCEDCSQPKKQNVTPIRGNIVYPSRSNAG